MKNALTMTETTQRVDHAIRLSSKGMKVIPLHSLGECRGCTCGNERCESVAKHPISKIRGTNLSWESIATNDLKEVRRIWEEYPFANIGVPTGKVNGFFVLDVDGVEGRGQIHDWILEHGEFPATWQVQTGKGFHLYYKYPREFEVGCTRGSLGFGIDTRGDHGYVLGVGSTHHTGANYVWGPGRSYTEIEIADAPQFLLELLREVATLKLGALDKKHQIKLEDYRNKDHTSVMHKASKLMRTSKWFRETLEGKRLGTDKSNSALDLSLANCLVKQGWENQEIVDFLYHRRFTMGGKLKVPGYYQSTIAKARDWGGDQKDNVVELDRVRLEERVEDAVQNEEAIPILEEPTVRAFPVHVFPKQVRDFVYAVAKGVQVPADLVGVHALTACGAGIGATRRIEVKEGWQEQPNLFSMVVAEPGTGKSPALAKAFKPVLSMQTALTEKYEAELIEYHKELKASEHDKDADVPQPPVMGEIYVTSATIEAMNNVMSVNTRGIINKADELAGTFKGWGQYKGGKGDDEESMLSNWSGTDIKINRVGKPPLVIPNPFCAITGNITPATVSDFKGEKENNGLLHRFLIAYPNKQKTPRWTEEGVPSYLAEGYEHVLKALYRLEFKREQVPEVLYMNAEAGKVFSDWYDRIMAEMDKEDFPPKLRGVWSKMPAQIARIALILQLTWAVCGQASKDEIEKLIMERAINVAEYFMSHARKVYFHLGDSANDARITEALHFIKKQGGEVKKEDIWRKRVSGCKKSSEVDALFEELVDLGYGRMVKEKPEGRGRPLVYFKLF